MKAPFAYFGGKSSVATFVWLLLGDDLRRYFEPFGGSLAVLLARDRKQNKIYHEIVNDIDALIINVWRALKYAPTDVAKLCADPNSQALYWQRICYLVKEKEKLLECMIKDDEYYDVKLAAYWLYYKGGEIGAVELDKIDIDRIYNSLDNGITAGRNQLVSNNGIHSQYNKIIGRENKLIAWFNDIQKVIENTKITCLDWKRLFNENTHWQDSSGTRSIGIFFDPPYSNIRRANLYRKDSYELYKEVNEFCVKNANRKTYRIVIAGYEGEHNNLENYGYTKYEWHAHTSSTQTCGGYSNLSKSDNKYKERLALRTGSRASKTCHNIDIGNMTIPQGHRRVNEYLKILDNKKIACLTLCTDVQHTTYSVT